MGSLFSSANGKKQKQNSAPAANNVSSKDRAILDLKNAKDRLKKYKKKLEVESVKLTEQAKVLVIEKKKDRALLVLKFRKCKENQLQQLDNQLLSIMEMIENVEWEHANMEVMKALQSGNASLKKLHEEMTIDDIAQLLEETQEGIEMENQINEMIASQATSIDQSELEAELNMIMGINTTSTRTEELPITLPDVPTTIPIPTVTTEVVEEVTEDSIQLEIAS